MMSNGLGKTNALAHAFAVAGHLAPSYGRHAGAIECFIRELRGLVVAETVKAQRPINKVVAIRARREGIKLRAVADLAEERDGLLRRETEDVNRTVGWFDQPGE